MNSTSIKPRHASSLPAGAVTARDAKVAWAAASVAAEAMAAADRAHRQPAKVIRQSVEKTLARPKVLLEAP